MEQHRLIIFDLDGTLVEDRDSIRLLPGRARKLAELAESGVQLAVATNQGGVGLRYWLESDPDFREWARSRGMVAEKYPSADELMQRFARIQEQIARGASPQVAQNIRWYACFAYQLRDGRWTPAPPDTDRPEWWDPANRKPNPGMLLQAMETTGAQPATTLMVGDRQDDRRAARQARCSFMWAEQFFEDGHRPGHHRVGGSHKPANG
jgi:HAD superfamily hydrolase (TIGR01662 family)